VGDRPSIAALTVLQNQPNPFSGTTELAIGLPTGSDIRVEIYDMAGRRVDLVEVKGAPAGWNRVRWAGRDTRANVMRSGVYVYRVSANGQTIARKMVIAR
jgi:hypothetical protein